jgi:hypothetical protein
MDWSANDKLAEGALQQGFAHSAFLRCELSASCLDMDDGHDSHKIRHKFFKRLRYIELATNASSSEKFRSIHFATLFEIIATWCFLYKPLIINKFQVPLDRRE